MQPTSLIQAFQLAKLMEDRFADSTSRSQAPPPPPRPPRLHSSQPPLLPLPNKDIPSPVPGSMSFHRLSATQMAERKAKGLCFNCPERFHRGHVCRAQTFMLIATNEDYEDSTLPVSVEEPETPSPTENLEIIFNAYTGHINPRTLRLLGKLNGRDVHVLIDSGSTHNFLQSKWHRFLHQPASPTHDFDVMVGNGERLPCSGKY